MARAFARSWTGSPAVNAPFVSYTPCPPCTIVLPSAANANSSACTPVPVGSPNPSAVTSNVIIPVSHPAITFDPSEFGTTQLVLR